MPNPVPCLQDSQEQMLITGEKKKKKENAESVHAFLGFTRSVWSYRETGGVKGGRIQPCSWHCCSAQPFRAREHQLPSHKHTCTGRASFAASSLTECHQLFAQRTAATTCISLGSARHLRSSRHHRIRKLCEKQALLSPFTSSPAALATPSTVDNVTRALLLPWKSKLSFLDQTKQQSPLLSRPMEFEQLTKSCYFSGRGGFGHTETALNVFGSL